MMKRFLVVILLWVFGAAVPRGLAQAENLPPLEDVETPSPAYDRNWEVIEETARLLENRDMDGLEKLAARLREGRERQDNGVWILSTFYDTATNLPDDGENTKKAMEFYELWSRERPESITAQVCLAMALTNYSWQFKDNYDSKEGSRLAQERLKKADTVLENVANLKSTCPGWFEAALDIGLEQEWSRDTFMRVANDAIEQEPSYGEYYSLTCYWFAWYGEEGEFETWIADLADKYPLEKQDLRYAFFVWMADRMNIGENIVFSHGRLNWQRTKRGFENWLQQEPDNLVIRSEFIRLALLAYDRQTAREQFEIIGGRYTSAIWDDKDEFEQARRFAFSNGANPLMSGKSGRTPTSLPKLTPDQLAVVKTFCRIIGGFLGGGVAGLLLLILAIQRGQLRAGLIAGVGSVILGSLFGTLTALIPATVLWLYLRRRSPAYPPPLKPRSAWITLLWAVVLPMAYFGLGIAATMLAVIPLFFSGYIPSGEEIERTILSDGTAYLLAINSDWLCFLLLLVVCLPGNRIDWQNRLGLHRCRIVPSVLWTLLTVGIVFAVGKIMDPHMDQQTREASHLMALGLKSPVTFFLAIVIGAPLWEELLFRGYAYAGWINKIGFWGTASATSFLFALCHIQYGLIGILYIFIFGFLLAALRWRTGSIYPCIAAHMINNLIYSLSSMLRT